MSKAREKYYMEMNDEFTVVDKITAGNYSDELEQQKADMQKTLDIQFNANQKLTGEIAELKMKIGLYEDNIIKGSEKLLQLEQKNEILKDDKRVFINECNELRIKKIKLEQEKAELINAYEDLLNDSMVYYFLYPNCHRMTAEEYFKDDIELLNKHSQKQTGEN